MKKLLLGLVLTAGVAMAANLGACTGCHGGDWSKSALGKSKVVSEMSQEDIVTTLKGYKDGSYGGPMKNLMVSQVAKYSDEELEAMASQIAGK